MTECNPKTAVEAYRKLAWICFEQASFLEMAYCRLLPKKPSSAKRLLMYIEVYRENGSRLHDEANRLEEIETGVQSCVPTEKDALVKSIIGADHLEALRKHGFEVFRTSMGMLECVCGCGVTFKARRISQKFATTKCRVRAYRIRKVAQFL